MTTPFTRVAAAMVAAAGIASAACTGASAPAQNSAAADQVAATWTNAFNSGNPSTLAALYAEDARSAPPDSAAITGRSAIESYWRQDIGSGGVTTKMMPGNSVAQGDLLHVNGAYQVTTKDGNMLARGQYQQLWRRTDDAWRVQDEIWRIDPSLQRDPGTAEQLASQWTAAYNAGDATRLTELYDKDAEISMRPDGSIVGATEIGSFWKADFGSGKPSTTLTLTDAYMSGDLAHLEGQYAVEDKGKVTKGRYVQLWMREAEGWRIHREMWWQQ